jgi:hypothetical protein
MLGMCYCLLSCCHTVDMRSCSIGLEEMLDDLVLGEEEEVQVGEDAFDGETQGDGVGDDASPGPAKTAKKSAAARSNPY